MRLPGLWQFLRGAVLLAVIAVIAVYGRQFLPGGASRQTISGVATVPVTGAVPSSAVIIVDQRWIYLYGLVAPREEPDCTVGGVTLQCTLISVGKVAEFVAGHEVRCRVRHYTGDDRNWGQCWVDGAGTFGNASDSLNARLVRAGWAFAAPRTRDFAADEAAAKAAKAGMWVGEAFSHPDFLKGPLRGSSENADGGTAELREVRIKLFGVDAPALTQECTIGGKPYPCGYMSHQYLNSLTDGHTVNCKVSQLPGDDRTFGICTEENPLSRQLSPNTFNEQIVRAGWALADRARSLDYVEAEDDARTHKRGLWQGEFIPPTDWRNGKR